MTLYECLGIDPFLMNETIPADMIIDNIDQAGLRNDARRFFNDITRVSLRASFNRDNHYLQVIEVELNNVMHINEISVLIQKAIRYQVLFVFVYDERYLLMRRSFSWIFDNFKVVSIFYYPAEMKLYGSADISSVTAVIKRGETDQSLNMRIYSDKSTYKEKKIET